MMINHECYVSLEVAKLLKEAGFDWKCHGIYVLDSENDPEYVFSTANFTNISKEIEGYIRLSAPTLYIAQKWLRDVHHLHITITPDDIEFKKWGWTIFASNYVKYSTFCQGYSTYEEAQEAGIKKALEIILDKGE